MFSDPKIKESILRKKGILEDLKREETYLIGLLFDTALESDALQHSLRLERPLFQETGITPDNYTRESLRSASHNIQKAWHYGKANFSLNLSHDLIINVARILEPDLRKTQTGYREVNVTPTGTLTNPPQAYKVPLEMTQMLVDFHSLVEMGKAQHTDPRNYFDLGAWLSFHIMRIHPFEDGNGRTARIIHNLYLSHLDCYPAVVIKEAERKHYLELMNHARYGYKNRQGESKAVISRDGISTQEKAYYDYMAEKLDQSLDAVLTKA